MLEALCVCVLATLAVVAVTPSLGHLAGADAQLRRAAEAWIELDRIARIEARAYSPVMLRFDAPDSTLSVVRLDGGERTTVRETVLARRALPDRLHIEITDLRGEAIDGLRYTRRGASEDVVVRIEHEAGPVRTMSVAASTGWIDESAQGGAP